MILRALAFSGALFWSGQALAAPPLEAYGRLPAIEQVELAPSGERLAYIAVTGEERRLEIQDLSGRVLASLGVGGHKVRDLEWVGSDYLMIGITQTLSQPGYSRRQEFLSVVGFDVRKRSFTSFLESRDRGAVTSSRLNRAQARTPRIIYGDPIVTTIDGAPAALVQTANLDGSRSVDLFRVNLDTGTPTMHAQGSRETVDFVVAADGRVLAREEFDDDTGRWRLLVRDGAGWREALSATDRLDGPSLLGVGRDGRSMLVARLQGGERRLVEVTPDGAVSEPLEEGRRIDAVVYDEPTGRLLGVALAGATAADGPDYRFYEPRLQTAWQAVQRGFPGEHLRLVSWSPDFNRLVVLAEGKSSGVYYLVDRTSRRADIIGEAYPGVPTDQVSPKRMITYKAADGLDIPAYLTLPVGREAKGLPMVVLPHGGPAARDDVRFDWWSQALASRGYAVLQPQFRGSAGFGHAFMEAGYGQWGRKMQTDLSDGVRHLAAQGTVDPKRVCVVGASYGGYAALAGITLEPDVYRCAVAVAGVADLPRMLAAEASDARDAGAGNVLYWSRFMGANFRQRDSLIPWSPAQQAARAGGPVLLIHGRDDTVVPFEQSAVMERALKQAGKPVELVTLGGEDHWLSREATRLRMLAETVRFLERHNPPR